MSITPRIKLRHLELIVKIAETQQLQSAARASAISQPAASRILAELETQMGAPIFTRHPKGMELTPMGEVIVQHARVMLSELETMVDEVQRVSSGDLGQVRVGTVTGPTPGHLMPAVQAVLEEAPELRISVDVAPSNALIRGLEEGRYDFILGRANPRSQSQGLHFHPGRAEIISLVVHKSHPLAGKSEVDLAELGAYPWVIQEEGSPIREAVERAFHSQSLPVPTRVLNSSSLLVALSRLVESATIAPQSQELMRLLTSAALNADLTTLNTTAQISVAPYFVIRDATRKLSRAAERLLAEVMSRF